MTSLAKSITLAALLVSAYIGSVSAMILFDSKETKQVNVDVSAHDFRKSLDACHEQMLSLHAVKSEAICIQKSDKICTEYATKTTVTCGDVRIKSLQDFDIIFITRSFD